MTELTQPLAAAPSEAVQGAAQSVAPRCTTFSELVYVHFDWWKALRKGTLTPAAAAEYQAARSSFEERHGEIVSAYWCSHVESAVALTHKKRRSRGRARSRPSTASPTGRRRKRRRSRPSSIAATSSR